MTKYVERESYKSFRNNSGRILSETLNEYYPYIQKAIEKEKYLIEYEDYDTFNEVIYENKVVGFIVCQKHPIVENIYSITESYVLPKFRGNNLIYDILKLFILNENLEFLIRRPNKAFIKMLEKNNLTFKLKNNLVVSAIKFHIEIEEIYKNSNIEYNYRESYHKIPYKANIFDFNISSSLFRDPRANFIKSDEFFACSQPRQYDLIKYKLHKKLKKVNDTYLDKRYFIWQSNAERIMKFQKNSQDKLMDSISVDEVLGDENHLEENFVENLKKNNLSVSDGFRIRQHIVDALDKDQLSLKSYNVRVGYLLNNFEDVDKKIDSYKSDVVKCPFCMSKIPEYYNSCPHCGLHVRDIDYEEYAIRKNFTFKNLFIVIFLYIIFKIYSLFRRDKS